MSFVGGERHGGYLAPISGIESRHSGIAGDFGVDRRQVQAVRARQRLRVEFGPAYHEDFTLASYDPHPAIKAPIAV